MESAKLKKFVTAILWFLFLIVANWYLIGSRHALEYKEYIEIVESIEDAKLDSECVIDLKVETESPWGWTPASMWLSITKDEVSVATTTSKFFKSDRIEQTPGTYYYYFDWSVDTSEGLVASYLELEMSRDKKLNWIKVGECSAIDRNEYFSKTYKGCKNKEHRAVKCS
jgi:hypothetical protein